MEDKILWNNLRSGESTALETIYRTFFTDLYRYGKSFTRDTNTVEDAIQELFIDLWESRNRLSETDAIKPYLYISLKRRIFKALKKDKKTSEKEVGEFNFEAELAIDQIIINNELKEEQIHALESAFGNLSNRQKEILYLKYYAEMDYEDISEAMDLNYQSARNLVSRALVKLSKQIILLILVIIFTLK